MLTREIKDALGAFYHVEYEEHGEELAHSLNEAERDPQHIGIMFSTAIDDDDETELGDVQVELNADTNTFIYTLNGKQFYEEKCSSEEEVAENIENSDFDGWYSYCMDVLRDLHVIGERDDDDDDEED